MSQMSEAAKKRMRDAADTHWNMWNGALVPAALGWTEKQLIQFGYKLGMSDPDTNKELLNEAIKYVEELMYPEAKTRDMGTYNKAIQDAVNRLNKIREARK